MNRSRVSLLLFASLVLSSASCGRAPEPKRPRNLLLITIDTIRADRVGAYGYARGRTPRIDAVAARGTTFERAYAAAPITLPSHATILSGLYPPGHGARDNGMKVSDRTPTLATELKNHGFRTAAFVGAFPLDHQFGLARGFDVYGDRLPRDAAGRQANERPASEVVTEAITWLGSSASSFFMWVHLFDPHAPYEGDASRPTSDRYDDEIAKVDREIGRLLDALGDRANATLIIVAGDHGEAFGEHGEYAHSIFVYDTTLRVPLIVAGPDINAGRVAQAVTLADVAPTAMGALGLAMKNVDGVDLSRSTHGEPAPARELYAESFAPLVEFGWAPLRSVRSGEWKYIAAPRPELFDVQRDAGEQRNLVDTKADVARNLDSRANRYSPEGLAPNALAPNRDSSERLRALGYSSPTTAPSPTTPPSPTTQLPTTQPPTTQPPTTQPPTTQPPTTQPPPTPNPQSPLTARADPKDRRELAARIAQVTSGELQGAALVTALEAIVREDPHNGQARMRLGYARVQAGDCAGAEPEFHAALAAGLQSADAYLGLAGCLGARRDFGGAERALNQAKRLEPDNPVIVANIGILKGSRGDHAGAIEALNAALAADPNLHEARFNLALTYARAGRRKEAENAAEDLLRRLPAGAPQRAEVERLVQVIRQR